MSLFDIYISKKLGGGFSDRFLGSKEYDISTTSTSWVTVGTFNVPGSYTSDNIICVRIRDKAGKRNGHLLESICFATNSKAANNTGDNFTGTILEAIGVTDTGVYSVSSTFGIYPSAISSNGDITISAKYNSSVTYGTIDGTYVVEVYALNWPNDDNPFA